MAFACCNEFATDCNATEHGSLFTTVAWIVLGFISLLSLECARKCIKLLEATETYLCLCNYKIPEYSRKNFAEKKSMDRNRK